MSTQIYCEKLICSFYFSCELSPDHLLKIWSVREPWSFQKTFRWKMRKLGSSIGTRGIIPQQKCSTKSLARDGEACLTYSIITNWIRALTRGEDIHGHAAAGGRLPNDRVDTRVTNALEESPFHSVRSSASTIKIPPTTVWRHLHARGYVVRNLHIVPHMLSFAQKRTRVEPAIEWKKVLCSAKQYGWRYILTDDESWLYFTINPDHAWVPEGAVTPTRSRQTVGNPKRMLTVF
jgi:hypothetical protein